jgi:hypothetical protein
MSANELNLRQLLLSFRTMVCPLAVQVRCCTPIRTAVLTTCFDARALYRCGSNAVRALHRSFFGSACSKFCDNRQALRTRLSRIVRTHIPLISPAQHDLCAKRTLRAVHCEREALQPFGIMQKTLLLVDGSSYLYRAFHALPDLRSPDGEPTGAMHGMINMLRRLRQDYPATYIACVFDAKGKTFRDDLYPQYKAQRASMPEDLARQIEPIHLAVRAMGWPILMV